MQSSEVSKRYSPDAGMATTLPVAAGFVGGQSSAPQRSNTAMAADFLNLEFRMESGRALPVLSRFDGPITVAMAGDVPGTARTELAHVIARFRSEAGLDVRAIDPGIKGRITILFYPRAELQRVVPSAACFVVPRVASLADYKAKRNTQTVDWAFITRRDQVAIFVPSDTSPQEVRDCLHEELAQAMGPLNDLYSLPDSVFNDDNFNTVLTGFDMLMLRVHYSPDLSAGMNEAEVAKRLPAILAKLNPAGETRKAAATPLGPRSWIDAVTNAFNPRGSQAARKQAADRMLSIAAAQGWNDSRLGFSYFAIGRLNVASDPQAAVTAFSQAGRIYRAMPGGAIHAAHVDMQLAAIALQTGQPGQAIQFADRAIPAVKQAENAALLATLMLLKAEAHEALGQTDAARALRLDSQPMARYGFGAEQQVRQRAQEIASIAARGSRS